MDLEARYNIKLKPGRKPVRPIPIDLTSEAGQQWVLEIAKRVMATHADVLAALARAESASSHRQPRVEENFEDESARASPRCSGPCA